MVYGQDSGLQWAPANVAEEMGKEEMAKRAGARGEAKSEGAHDGQEGWHVSYWEFRGDLGTIVSVSACVAIVGAFIALSDMNAHVALMLTYLYAFMTLVLSNAAVSNPARVLDTN